MRRETSAGLLLPARLLLALAGGGAIALAFPQTNWWWAAWLGCALIAAAGWAVRWRTGLLVGLLAGLAYFSPTLSWSGIYVGKLPWFALATLEALYIAAMLAVVGPIQRGLLARGWALAAYAVVPLGWVVGEWARSTTPFGGFPWARLAFSQADSPLRALASLGGAPLVSAAVAAIGVLGYAAVRAARERRHAAVVAGLAGAALALAPLLIPLGGSGLPDGTPVPTARIGLVQGNVPKPGLDFNAERRAVLDNHVRVTEELMSRPTTGDLDLVVWPENASDIDPLRNSDAAAAVTMALTAAKAPLLIGAILNEPHPYVSNASLLYRPGGGEPERYLKQHPVPFAEYVPFKDFFRRFNDKVDLVRYGMAKGDRVGYFELTTAGSAPSDPVAFAVLPTICFEVAYDGLIRDAVRHGELPSVLAVQTNNATFGFTAESAQQYAISRLRAIEHNRAVVHVSTVGISGFISPDGTTTRPSTLFTAYAAVDNLPLHSTVTLADRLGPAPEYAALAALLALAGAATRLGRRDRTTSIPPSTDSKELARA